VIGLPGSGPGGRRFKSFRPDHYYLGSHTFTHWTAIGTFTSSQLSSQLATPLRGSPPANTFLISAKDRCWLKVQTHSRDNGRSFVRIDALVPARIHCCCYVVVRGAALNCGISVSEGGDERGVDLRIRTSTDRAAIDVVSCDRRCTRIPSQRHRMLYRSNSCSR